MTRDSEEDNQDNTNQEYRISIKTHNHDLQFSAKTAKRSKTQTW